MTFSLLIKQVINDNEISKQEEEIDRIIKQNRTMKTLKR